MSMALMKQRMKIRVKTTMMMITMEVMVPMVITTELFRCFENPTDIIEAQ